MLTEVAQAMLTQAPAGGTSIWSTVLMFVVLIGVFYFLLIRPEGKKKKAAAKMRSELGVGDEITTIGGIVGIVCTVKEDTIVLETGADRVRVEFTKWAISTRGTQTTDATPSNQEATEKKGFGFFKRKDS